MTLKIYSWVRFHSWTESKSVCIPARTFNYQLFFISVVLILNRIASFDRVSEWVIVCVKWQQSPAWTVLCDDSCVMDSSVDFVSAAVACLMISTDLPSWVFGNWHGRYDTRNFFLVSLACCRCYWLWKSRREFRPSLEQAVLLYSFFVFWEVKLLPLHHFCFCRYNTVAMATARLPIIQYLFCYCG